MKAYIAVAALMLAAGTVHAQDDLTRRVDVAKEYAPRVDRASKLAIQPQTGDTTTLRPDLEYTVRPRAWMGGFGVAPIRAAQMNTGTYSAQYPLYIKAGGGYPGQTLLDVYATSTRPGASGFGAYVNHRAQLSDIGNYYGIKQKARSTTNSVGAFGKAVFGRQNRLSVAGELGFDYDVWTNYAMGVYGENRDPVSLESKYMQHYAIPRGAFVFGNDFTDLSFLNFRLGGDIYNMSDRTKYKETGGKAFAEFGRMFDLHRVVLGAGVDMFRGKRAYEEEKGKSGNSIFNFYADYRLEAGKMIFGLGARLAYNKPISESKLGGEFVFLPQAELRFAIADGVNPYVALTSSQRNQNYRNIAAQNPYTFYPAGYPFWGDPDIVDVKPRTDYDLRAGLSGSFSGVFSYDVYVGGGITKHDFTTFYPEEYDARMPGVPALVIMDNFWPMFDGKRKYFIAGAELAARIGGGFTATLAGEYRNYDSDLYDIAEYLPKFTASVGLKYNHRDKLSIRAGIDLAGKYQFLKATWIKAPGLLDGYYEHRVGDTTPVGVDVSLTADYNISEKLGVFVEGHNLANKKLYSHPMLPGVGINVSAGVKLRF